MMAGDYSVKSVQEHHIIMGTSGRAKSEELGLKVNLCENHHIYGPEAVHNNAQNRRTLRGQRRKRMNTLIPALNGCRK